MRKPGTYEADDFAHPRKADCPESRDRLRNESGHKRTFLSVKHFPKLVIVREFWKFSRKVLTKGQRV